MADTGVTAYPLCRPSDHPDRADHMSGFCYPNAAAVAASGLLGRFGASPCWAAALPTVIVQEGSYATEAIGDCLDAFRGGFVLGVE